MQSSLLLLTVHTAATLAMVGVIWFVQVVHYPLFVEVGERAFSRYEQLHQRLTSRVVAPLMLTELSTAGLLICFRPPDVPLWAPLGGAVLVGLLWLSTFCWQVPLHQRLSRSFDRTVQQRLVSSNWLRTVLWTTRGGLALWMLASV